MTLATSHGCSDAPRPYTPLAAWGRPSHPGVPAPRHCPTALIGCRCAGGGGGGRGTWAGIRAFCAGLEAPLSHRTA